MMLSGFVSERSKQKLKSFNNSSEDDMKESNQPDYDENENHLEEKQEQQPREITTNHVL